MSDRRNYASVSSNSGQSSLPSVTMVGECFILLHFADQEQVAAYYETAPNKTLAEAIQDLTTFLRTIADLNLDASDAKMANVTTLCTNLICGSSLLKSVDGLLESNNRFFLLWREFSESMTLGKDGNPHPSIDNVLVHNWENIKKFTQALRKEFTTIDTEAKNQAETKRLAEQKKEEERKAEEEQKRISKAKHDAEEEKARLQREALEKLKREQDEIRKQVAREQRILSNEAHRVLLQKQHEEETKRQSDLASFIEEKKRIEAQKEKNRHEIETAKKEKEKQAKLAKRIARRARKPKKKSAAQAGDNIESDVDSVVADQKIESLSVQVMPTPLLDAKASLSNESFVPSRTVSVIASTREPIPDALPTGSASTVQLNPLRPPSVLQPFSYFSYEILPPIIRCDASDEEDTDATQTKQFS